MLRPTPSRTDAAVGFGLALLVFLLGAVTAPAEEPKAKAPSPDPDRPKLTIKWSTSSEVDNYGFYVMRSDAEKGPFKEINAKLIPGAGNSDLPRRYSFDDPDVQMGRTYYYYLDAVSTRGIREKYSPVMAKQCCDRPGAKAPEAQELKDQPAGAPSPAAAPSPAEASAKP